MELEAPDFFFDEADCTVGVELVLHEASTLFTSCRELQDLRIFSSSLQEVFFSGVL